jgi:hypothetical protein
MTHKQQHAFTRRCGKRKRNTILDGTLHTNRAKDEPKVCSTVDQNTTRPLSFLLLFQTVKLDTHTSGQPTHTHGCIASRAHICTIKRVSAQPGAYHGSSAPCHHASKRLPVKMPLMMLLNGLPPSAWYDTLNALLDNWVINSPKQHQAYCACNRNNNGHNKLEVHVATGCTTVK